MFKTVVASRGAAPIVFTLVQQS